MCIYQLIDVFLVGSGLLVVITLLAPVLVFLRNGWELRRREIYGSFNAPSILRYFQTFFPTEIQTVVMQQPSTPATSVELTSAKTKYGSTKVVVDDDALKRRFLAYYAKCFGRQQFFNPLILLMSITLFFIVFTGIAIRPYLLNLFGLPGVTELIPAKWYYLGAISGFAGGYLYVIRMLTSRWQERTLSPSDLFASSVRLLISVPIALSITAIFRGALKEPALYALCFMLGAFPTEALMTFLRRTAASKLNLEGSFDETATGLMSLQDIRRNQAEIFSKEGVETILQLAYADPVDLTIRTGFSFSYVIDCCSQALAWLRFEENLTKMRKFGLRGAQEIITFVYELNQDTDQDKKIMEAEQKRAESTLDVLAAELNLNKIALNRTLEEIAFDPYAQFLNDIWHPEWN